MGVPFGQSKSNTTPLLPSSRKPLRRCDDCDLAVVPALIANPFHLPRHLLGENQSVADSEVAIAE